MSTVLIILNFMKKSAIKIFIGVLIFFAFLSVFFIYLNKINRAVENNSRLLLLPEKIPLRKEGDTIQLGMPNPQGGYFGSFSRFDSMQRRVGVYHGEWDFHYNPAHWIKYSRIKINPGLK